MSRIFGIMSKKMTGIFDPMFFFKPLSTTLSLILSLWSESSNESCLEWFLLTRHGPFLWTRPCLTISQHNINRLRVCIVVGQYGSLATLLITLWVCCQMLVYLGSQSSVAGSPLYLLLIHTSQSAFSSPCEECYLAEGGASIYRLAVIPHVQQTCILPKPLEDNLQIQFLLSVICTALETSLPREACYYEAEVRKVICF